MVDVRDHNPTNALFRDRFQKFAGTKTQKGDLNSGDGSVVHDTGVLVRIEKSKILQNGWEVEVSEKRYKCTNDSDRMIVPPHTESQKYYVPNDTIQVDVSLDKKNHIYKILRMHLQSTAGTSTVQSDGTLTILSPSASSILPHITSTHDTDEDIAKKQSQADGSAIALRENTISLVGDIYINNTNLQETLDNKLTTTEATVMETLNTKITSDAIAITFKNKYSQIPSINLTNEHEEKLNYTYTFNQNSDGKYTGVNVYFTSAPPEQNINILVVGNP